MRVAEELFATEGLDAVSLRRIMDAAHVGASQLNYHFGTKKELLRAIFHWKYDLLSEERLRLLSEAEKQEPPMVEAIVEAYFRPTFRTFSDPSALNFVRLVARIGADSSDLAKEISAEFLDVLQRRFAQSLARALPGLDEREIYWRIHLMLSVAIQTLVNPGRIYNLSKGQCDPSDSEAMFRSLQPILCAALRYQPPAVSSALPTTSRSTRPKK